MIACSTAVSKNSTPSVEELLTEFQLFRSASESLEKAYRELNRQAQRVDRELAEANRRLRQGLEEREGILGALPLGVFRRNGEKLESLNPEAQTMLQRVEATVLLRDLAGRNSACLSIQDRAGNLLSLRVTSVNVGEDGTVLEFIDDQTDIEAMAEELDRLARLSSLSELALGVAHEVRNPLNAVAGFASMLKRSPDSPKAAHWAGLIEKGAGRVDRIVSELLSFAKPEERAEPITLSLPAWLAEAKSELPGLMIELNALAEKSQLRGSPQALGKVFANLLRNAQEAGARHIAFSVEDLGQNRLRLEIQDDGEGISAEIQDRIFDPFVGSKDQGTGLGLAFCVRALEAMDGSIRSLSCQDGARFSIELGGRCHD